MKGGGRFGMALGARTVDDDEDDVVEILGTAVGVGDGEPAFDGLHGC
jgi:hypothetical protein